MEKINKIQSFTINHNKLTAGIYVSRKDAYNNVTVTTFDLRFTKPNREPPLDISAMHTIEHLFATFLRNSDIKDKIVYFGPMGCRTGFYLVVFTDMKVEDIVSTIKQTCKMTLSFNGKIFGTNKIECGNYLQHDLTLAKYYVKKYLDCLENDLHTEYPQ